MTIEVTLQNLINAINANTAAITGKAAPASSGSDEAAADEKKTSTRGRGRKAAGGDDDGDGADEKKTTGKKITREQLTTIMNKVKEDIDTKTAKGIIQKMGVERLAEIEDADIAKAYKLAEEALAKADEAGEDQNDDNL